MKPSSIILSIFLAGLLLCLSMPLKSKNAIDEPTGFNEKVFDATYVLYGKNNTDKSYNICTAMAYEKSSDGYHFISAGHCVRALPENTIFSVAKNMDSADAPVSPIKSHFDDGLDISIFDLKTTEKIVTIPIGSEKAERVGNHVVTASFGDGLDKQLSLGIISTDVFGKNVCDGCEGDFVVQVVHSKGSSGAGIVSEKTHKIIGILTNATDVGALIQPASAYPAFLESPEQIRVPVITLDKQ